MKKGKVENMKKRTIIIVLTAALAVSQTVCIFAASSPGTGPVIVDSNSDGSSYDIGERADRAKGGASGSTAVSSGQGNNAVQIAVGQTAGEQAVGTNSRGQAVIGDTALEFVQGTDAAVAGLPKPVVDAINGINSGRPLSEAVPGVDLTGYNALIGTHAIMIKDAATNTEKTGLVEVPLYGLACLGREPCRLYIRSRGMSGIEKQRQNYIGKIPSPQQAGKDVFSLGI